MDERPYGRPSHRAQVDEMDDFIEDDYPEDEEEQLQRQEDLEVARPRDKGFVGDFLDRSGLDQETLDEMDLIFGNGDEYNWVLEIEDEEEARQQEKSRQSS